VAAAQNDDAARRRHIASGLRLIQECHAPIAAWRLHALAGNADKAENILLGLAQSLAYEPNLSRSFLAAPDVAAVLRRGKPATV
jgi:hypothetical protein